MIYYIGGFKETCNSEASIYLKNIGLICISIDWNMSIKDILEKLNKISFEKDSVIIGFSIGSLLALELASCTQNIKLLILCSLSPYFTGYKNEINPEVINLLGKNKINELMNLNIDSYGALSISTKFIFGVEEDSYVKKRIRDMFESWKDTDKEIIEIPECGHYINNLQYLSKIKEIIKSL